jgi:metal-responsive CopG/Arc/MetJ family transcriptional regulator
MPRPLKFPTKVLIGFDDDTIKALDAYRRKHELPNRSEAIRRLVDRSLAAEPAPTKPRRTAKKDNT